MKHLPSRAEILDWIAANPGQSAKRDIARAFGLKGAAKIELKALLREMAGEGLIEKKQRRFLEPDGLPPVAVLEVAGPDADGTLWARPAEWTSDTPAPRIEMLARPGEPALGEGDRVLARLSQAVVEEDRLWQGRLIRRIGAGPRRVLGIFRKGTEGGRIVPIEKSPGVEWMVRAGDSGGARDGELVEAYAIAARGRIGLPQARIAERLGDPGAPRAVSLIAIHAHGIPDEFPDEVLAAAEAAEEASPDGRRDLRDLPLITIDPEDARDHDDAVCALADDDPANPGGHIVWVAIADVAHYVRAGSALDREARKRGNSTYFPDRVVPMLPERLSADLCSLMPGVDRPCIALRIVLDAGGHKISHRFERALMRSPAALTYQQVQAAFDGTYDQQTEALSVSVLAPLHAAWKAAAAVRAARHPLDLDLPERRIVLSPAGRVVSVAFRDRLDAHRLVEDFMVLANVCAAETLEQKRTPLLYRVHEEPAPEKLDALREVVQAAGLVLAKGQVLKTRHLNRLLEQAAGTPHAEVINMSVLRSMPQAYYSPDNLGHFGLAQRRYAHFTSPIRRYADLVVHRALIAAHRWGNDGLTPSEEEALEATAEHISATERRSMAAERDTTDRYLASFLAERLGESFSGRISGIARFGVFVKLDETGADGLVPIGTIGAEYFHHDRDAQTLMGDRSGLLLRPGMVVTVRLAEAVPITGGLMLELQEIEGKAMPRGPSRSKGGTPRRKLGALKATREKSRKRERRQKP